MKLKSVVSYQELGVGTLMSENIACSEYWYYESICTDQLAKYALVDILIRSFQGNYPKHAFLADPIQSPAKARTNR
jgi:hypothetical protein